MQRRTLMILAALAVALLIGVATPVAGQEISCQGSPNYVPDFTSNQSCLTLNGNSSFFLNSNNQRVLRLTQAATSQAGSAWFKVPQPLSAGFSTTFTFQVTNASPAALNFPGDGLAFVIQNSTGGTGALGGAGGGIGYQGISNSLAVEFDTFQNTYDPNANHVAVQSCGTAPNTADHTATCQIGDFSFPSELGINSDLSSILSDGNPHTVKIEYTPPIICEICDVSSGSLAITLDNNLVLTVPVDLSSLLTLGEGGTALVGFTAATGDFEENNDILSWTFTPHSGTSITQEVPPGQTTVFTFGSYNWKVTPGGTNTVTLTVTSVPIPPDSFLPGAPFSGTQCIVYEGTGGNCVEFSVSCSGQDCTGVPYQVATSYDVPANSPPITAPGFLKADGQICPTSAFNANIISAFFQQRQDPTTVGTSGGGYSCFVATENTTGTPGYNFTGFFNPVLNTRVNLATAGQAIPLQFHVTDTNNAPVTGLTLKPPGTITVQNAPNPCGNTNVLIDTALGTAAASGGSGLQNLGNGFYTFVWKTQKAWSGTCRVVEVELGDHIIHYALFQFR